MDRGELDQIAATDAAREETLRRVPHTSGQALTIQQVSDITGFQEGYLRRMCRNYKPGSDTGDSQHIKARRVSAVGSGPPQWIIERSELAAFLERRKPPATRFCYDATFTLAKSVSLLGLLSSDRLRTEVVAAAKHANQTDIDHLNVHASSARVTEDGRIRVVQSDGLAVASYMHATSRADDPALHIHNVILNAVSCEDGVDRTINSPVLYRESATASALAEAELRWQLMRRLGVVFVPKDDTRDISEVVGFDADILAAFSKRRAEIEASLTAACRTPRRPRPPTWPEPAKSKTPSSTSAPPAASAKPKAPTPTPKPSAAG